MLDYKVVARENPLERLGPPPKYYPTLVRGKMTGQDFPGKEISAMCTMIPADVPAVVTFLLSLFREHLLFGNSIRPTRLNIFGASLQCTGEQNAADVSASNFKKLKILYRPSAKMKYLFKEFRFTKPGS